MNRLVTALCLLVATGCGTRNANSISIHLPRSAHARILIRDTAIDGGPVHQGKTITTDAALSGLPQ